MYYVIVYIYIYINIYIYLTHYPPPCLARVRVMGLRNDCSTLWVCLVLTKGPPPLLTASIEPRRINRGPQKVIIFLHQFLILFRIGPRNGAKMDPHKRTYAVLEPSLPKTAQICANLTQNS